MGEARDNPNESRRRDGNDRSGKPPQGPQPNPKLQKESEALRRQGAPRAQAPNTADKHLPKVEFRQKPLSPEAKKAVTEKGPINRDMKPKVVAEGQQPTKMQIVDRKKLDGPPRQYTADASKVQQAKAKLQEKSGRGPDSPSKGQTPPPQQPRK